jgi:hypothetical protein
VNDAVGDGDYSRLQGDAILRLARANAANGGSQPLDAVAVAAAADELLLELRKEGLPVDDVEGLVHEAVRDPFGDPLRDPFADPLTRGPFSPVGLYLRSAPFKPKSLKSGVQ